MSILFAAISISIFFSLWDSGAMINSDLVEVRNGYAASEERPDELFVLLTTYGSGASPDDIRERLDELASVLKNNPIFRAHIVSYAGPNSCLGEGKWRAGLARSYLMRVRKIPASQIAIVDGGHLEKWTVQLWYAPLNAPSSVLVEAIPKGRPPLTRNCKR